MNTMYMARFRFMAYGYTPRLLGEPILPQHNAKTLRPHSDSWEPQCKKKKAQHKATAKRRHHGLKAWESVILSSIGTGHIPMKIFVTWQVLWTGYSDSLSFIVLSWVWVWVC